MSTFNEMRRGNCMPDSESQIHCYTLLQFANRCGILLQNNQSPNWNKVCELQLTRENDSSPCKYETYSARIFEKVLYSYASLESSLFSFSSALSANKRRTWPISSQDKSLTSKVKVRFYNRIFRNEFRK